MILYIITEKGNNIPKNWYTGNTSLEILNYYIKKKKKKKSQDYAYLHHIERLMIINNFIYLM